MLRLRGNETRVFGIRRIDKGLIFYYYRQRILKSMFQVKVLRQSLLAKRERLKYQRDNLLAVVI